MTASQITILSRPGCHLCDELLPLLERLAGEFGIELERRNIDADPELQAKYSELVPVVLVDGREVGHWQIPEARLRAAIQGQPVTAAFFDLDNTVIRGSSLFHLARGMRKHNLFGGPELRSAIWKQLKFVVVGKEHIKDMEGIKTTSLKVIAGQSVAELDAKGAKVVDDYLVPKVFAQTHAIGAQHIANGEEVWLVTASPRRLAAILAQRLGFTGALGTEVEVVDGRYTGRMIGSTLHAAEKAAAVRRLAAERGYDLSRCTAYSDSIHDLPLLELVGHPVAVNADRRLRGIARRRGWGNLDFRKLRHARRYGLPALLAGLSGWLFGRRRGR